MTHNTINNAVKAAGKFWQQHCLKWNRKEWPYLALVMKGLRKTNPSTKRTSKPMTWNLLGPVLRHILKKRTLFTLALANAALGAYLFGNRSGEYTSDSTSLDNGAILFQLKHLEFMKNKDGSVRSVVFNIPKSKCNQFGDFVERQEAACTCGHKDCDVLCLPHLYIEYFKLRKRNGETLKPTSPVLVIGDAPMKQEHINNFVKYIATFHGLDPSQYRAHSLRSGRTTDLAKGGVPAWIIKKWGRWATACWEKHYAKLDCSDLSRLTNDFMNSTTEYLTFGGLPPDL